MNTGLLPLLLFESVYRRVSRQKNPIIQEQCLKHRQAGRDSRPAAVQISLTVRADGRLTVFYVQLLHRRIKSKIGIGKRSQSKMRNAISRFVRRRVNLVPSALLLLGRISDLLYRLSISVRSSSFDLPSFFWRRPRSSSSFPSENLRSSSVS